MTVSKVAYDLLSIMTMTDHKARLVRISPTDLKITLREIFASLSDLCWISQMPNANRIFKKSIHRRAESTIDKLEKELISNSDSTLSRDTGEYVVSELSHSTVVNDLGYLDIPLAELIKEKVSGNPGFDFFAENPKSSIVLFGEAKYRNRATACDSALEQIERFANEGKDVMDMADLEHFCTLQSQENMADGRKGFIAAFSSTSIADETLVANIEKNEHYKQLLKYEEVICVAVNLS